MRRATVYPVVGALQVKKTIGWIVLGIGIGIALSVAAAYVFGARSSVTYMDLYTGASWTDNHLLWHTWRSESPVAEHTAWARSHFSTDRRYWPVRVCFSSRGWFGRTIVGDAFPRDIVWEIYRLSVPEERKIELLHQLHLDIGSVVAGNSNAPYGTLYTMWDEKLKEAPQPADGE